MHAAECEVHAAECARVAAFNQVKDQLVVHENTGRLALRMLAKRSVQGIPTDGKAHWCDVQSAQDHSARVASLPSKLSANMEADGHLLFSLLPLPVASGLTAAADVILLLLKIKCNSNSVFVRDMYTHDNDGSTFCAILGLTINHSCSLTINT